MFSLPELAADCCVAACYATLLTCGTRAPIDGATIKIDNTRLAAITSFYQKMYVMQKYALHNPSTTFLQSVKVFFLIYIANYSSLKKSLPSTDISLCS